MPIDPPPLAGLDLNLLVTLRALLRESSVTRAAERLGQTQPTVSRSLSTLRAAFDDPLLVRSGREMRPTPLAVSLQGPLERCLADVGRLGSLGGFEPAESTRVFALAVPDLLAPILVSGLVARVRRDAPRVRLRVLASERDLLAKLLHGEVDLAVSGREFEHPDLRSRTVGGTFGWSVLVGPNHPSAHRMDLEAWLRSRHVQVTPAGRPDVPSPTDVRLREAGLTRDVALTVASPYSLPEVLREAPWVSTLPDWTADHLASEFGLVALPHPFADRLPVLPIRLSWLETHQKSAAHRWLRGLVVELFGAYLERRARKKEVLS